MQWIESYYNLGGKLDENLVKISLIITKISVPMKRLYIVTDMKVTLVIFFAF